MAKTRGYLIIILMSLAIVLQLPAADLTNTPAALQESWQSISNRWGPIAFEQTQQTAEQGDVTAQYYLACKYSYGMGLEKNPRLAFKWMNQAAQQGMARAQRNLGFMYDEGDGVEQDHAVAAKFFRLAAEQGDAMAQNALGWAYKTGQGVRVDPAVAVNWFQKSAAQGEEIAAENLAWIYAIGTYGPSNINYDVGTEAQVRSGGIAPNYDLAEKWMRQAVDLNSPEGQYRFAKLILAMADNEQEKYKNSKLYPDGVTNEVRYKGIPRYAKAAEWFRKAAEQGDAKAQFELADMLHTGQLGNDQRSNCIPWFLKAAEQGNAKAQTVVAKLPEYYPHSELLKKTDPIDLLKQAAARGELPAQLGLAWRYHAGDGVPKDAAEAFKWMTLAAEHEISPVTASIDAHYYLGVMYETGEGVTKDLAKACQLYEESAVGGNKPEPFTRLGKMYEIGQGVPQNDSLAVSNYYQATLFGFFPSSDDTARSTAIENWLNLYAQDRGLPGDKMMIGQQLDTVKLTPITTAKAQQLLGTIYFQGKLVQQDLAEAAAWFRLAADQNDDAAKKQLEQVEAALSSAQRATALARFTELTSKINQATTTYKLSESYRRSHSW